MHLNKKINTSFLGYFRFCTATAIEIQEFFSDSDFRARTKIDHDADVEFSTLTKETINGVKTGSCFSRLNSFHVIGGFPPDLLHDFLEGSLVYGFGLMMNNLIRTDFTFDYFIESINSFKYSRVDQKSKLSKSPFTKFALDTKKGK